MCNARFIHDFATITEPLRRLTRSDTLFEFGKGQWRAFKELKLRLIEAKLLHSSTKLLIQSDHRCEPCGLRGSSDARGGWRIQSCQLC